APGEGAVEVARGRARPRCGTMHGEEEPAMAYVVVYRGEESEQAYREYLLVVSRSLLHRGVSIDRVPRVPTPGRPDRWRYVREEAEARAFAEELRKYTEDDGWEARPAESPPAVGPLQPITIDLGLSRWSIGFGLDPITVHALQLRYPGSTHHREIWVKT